MIKPHGGKLVNRVLEEGKKEEDLKKIEVSLEREKDIKNIARGLYSPLTGFLKEEEFKSVVKEMRLKDGTVWPIPIVLDINKKEKEKIEDQKKILLINEDNKKLALLDDIEIYKNEKEFFAKNVFGTLDKDHPGVASVFEMGDFLIGGEIYLLDNSKNFFEDHNFSPKETREEFKKRGWEEVVGFQTRNVPHRGHEYLQKHALQLVDGLFINPVIGKKKLSDFKDEYIIASYDVLIDRYYKDKKVFFGILPLEMRYAGPREAIFHALIRKNFGCSHFIVGRDHAGVGDYYEPFAAQKIFDQFKDDEIGIKILKYKEVEYCPDCNHHVFIDECPHQNKVQFSGTKLRKMINEGKQPPLHLLRPEVYHFLANSNNSLVDQMYKMKNNNKKGFVLWFTGFSQAGKTTTANKVFEILKEKDIKVERLDGDIVRQYLSKDLGFTKEDRNENIKRVGFVSKLLSKNGVGIIASFISPYTKKRKEIRDRIESAGAEFIEVFCNCPLEVCEERDTKGLYEKARKGEIENFTGISDPYQKPENPEIEIHTDKKDTEECANKIVSYLEKKKII